MSEWVVTQSDRWVHILLFAIPPNSHLFSQASECMRRFPSNHFKEELLRLQNYWEDNYWNCVRWYVSSTCGIGKRGAEWPLNPGWWPESQNMLAVCEAGGWVISISPTTMSPHWVLNIPLAILPAQLHRRNITTVLWPSTLQQCDSVVI